MVWRAFLIVNSYNSLFYYNDIMGVLTYKYNIPKENIFIPGDGIVGNIYEGYIFIKDLDEAVAEKILAEKYFSKDVRFFSITEEDIQAMKNTVVVLDERKLSYGDIVRVSDGPYSKLYGFIVSPGEIYTEVGFNLCSQTIFVKIENPRLIFVKSLFQILKFPVAEVKVDIEECCKQHELQEEQVNILKEPANELEDIFEQYESDYSIIGTENSEEANNDDNLEPNPDDEYTGDEEPSVIEKYVAGYYADEEMPENGYSFDDFSFNEIYLYLEDFFLLFSNLDKDLIFLNFIARKSQIELAEIFKKTQPALSNATVKIKKQLKTVRYFKSILGDFLKYISEDAEISNRDKNILLVFLYTTSVTKVSRILGVDSAMCRARVFKAIEKLKAMPDAKRICEYFSYFMNNLNQIKKRVSQSMIKEIQSHKDYPSGHILQLLEF